MEYKNFVSRIGINNFTYRRFSMDYFLDSVNRLGVDRIELCGCHPHYTVYEQEEFPVKELATKIRAYGVLVSAILPEQNFLPVNIAAVNEYLRRQSVEQMKFYVRNAREFDCDKVVLYPGKAFMNYPPSEAWKRSRESIAEIVKTAEEYEVNILLEGVSNFVSGLMTDSGSVKQMMDEVGSDRLKCCVNSCTAYFAGETLEDYFKVFGEKVELIQLSDSIPDNDQLIWGEGDQDFRQHLDTIERYGYRGDIMMELLMEEYADNPEVYYKSSLDYLRKM